jgi:nitroreductase
MDVIEAIKTRKSIRAFKPDPVPKTVLEEVLKVAVRSPSGANFQPWEFVIVTGEVLEKLRQANVDKFNTGEAAQWDLSREAARNPIPEAYRARSGALQARMQSLMNFSREDREKRADWTRHGFRYFDAPAVIIVTMDKALNTSSFFDIGSVTQTICLAAVNHGLGTCIQGQGVMYSKMVREITGIPFSKHLVISIAIGYPDWSHPANKLVSDREPLENISTWLGFGENK